METEAGMGKHYQAARRGSIVVCLDTPIVVCESSCWPWTQEKCVCGRSFVRPDTVERKERLMYRLINHIGAAGEVHPAA